MNQSRPNPTLTAAALCIVLSTSHLALAQQSDQGRGERRGPPQQAFTACAELSAESQCSFQGKRGETLSGTCIVPPQGEESLVCAPADHQQRHRGGAQSRNTES